MESSSDKLGVPKYLNVKTTETSLNMNNLGTRAGTKLTVNPSLKTKLNNPTTNGNFRSEVVRKNWKTVLDVALDKRGFPNDETNFNLNSPNNVPNNDIFVSEKFNWIFFAIIMSILIILSIIFCGLVYKFFPFSNRS